jgi:pimeloyl-ACP methyl ester carboxylesterase
MLPGASGDHCGYNTEKIQRPGLKIPTLVIHGDSDRMVDVGGGRATAEAFPHDGVMAENVKRGISV